ncbi:S8 family peptidase [Halovivax gelatinilyticus]|uniref:S8 family peptidase n=1 Tax=Halovivax gelatinilyticus TaxID=2961597 RepID=UPI0020CA74BB|nr:S8 family serine peptidase [Halovivax gelatinilyticus]
MHSQTRRRFLATTGITFGAIGSATTGATTSTERFVVDSTSVEDSSSVEVIHRLDPIGVSVVRASENAVDSIGAAYAADAGGTYDRPTAPAGVTGASADALADSASLYDYQWDKHSQQIETVHQRTRGEGTRVAIVDSGVAAGHPDLDGAVNAELSKNFTEDDYGAPGPYAGSHGTHVAGIVAADGDVLGSAPETELVDCRVFTPNDERGLFAFLGDVLAAVVYSAEIGCEAANLSLGAYLPRQELGSFWGKAMNRTTTYAAQQGTVLAHAAGNTATDLQHDGPYVDTSMAARGLCVSSTGPVAFEPGAAPDEPFYTPAFYTNYGTNAIDLAAPGGNVTEDGDVYDGVLNCVADPEFDDDGEYLGATYGHDWFQGTSMAAPQVASAVALLASVDAQDNANRRMSTLRRVADVPATHDKPFYGSGYLDTLAAIDD